MKSEFQNTSGPNSFSQGTISLCSFYKEKRATIT